MNVAAASLKKSPIQKQQSFWGNISKNFTTLEGLLPTFEAQEKAQRKKQKISAAPQGTEHPHINQDKANLSWLSRLATYLKNKPTGTLQRSGKLLEALLENRNNIRTKSVIHANLLAVIGNTFTAFTQVLPNSFKILKKIGNFTGESFRASTLINALGSALIGRKQKDPAYTAAQVGDATQAFGDRSETYFNRAKFIGAYNAADYGKQILQDLKDDSETQNTKGGEYESYSHGASSLLKVPQKIFQMISKFGFKETFKNQNIQGFLMNIALMFTPGVKLLTKNSKALSNWLPDLYRNGLSLLGEIAGFSKKNANKPMWRIARLGFFLSTLFAQGAKTPGMPKWAKHMFTSINFAMDSGSKIIAMESRNRGEISDNPHHENLNIYDSFKYTMNTMTSMLLGKDKSLPAAPIVPIEAAHEIKAKQIATTDIEQAPIEDQLAKAPAVETKRERRSSKKERYIYRPKFFQPSYVFAKGSKTNNTQSSTIETATTETPINTEAENKTKYIFKNRKSAKSQIYIKKDSNKSVDYKKPEANNNERYESSNSNAKRNTNFYNSKPTQRQQNKAE